MNSLPSSPAVSVRALLQSTRTPFTVERLKPQDTIFSQGDACDTVMYIDEGRVRLSISLASGREAICGLVGTGAFLGDEVLGGHRCRTQTATAMVLTTLLIVPKAHMTRLLRAEQDMYDRFITHSILRKTSLEADLTVQLLYTSEQRLVHTLLTLAGCDGRGPGRYALPTMTQEAIAEMVGTTRSRVNLFMNKFKKLGFLEQSGGMLHLNVGQLNVVRTAARAH